MHADELREYLIAKPHSEECSPFGDEVLVYKLGGKIFAILGFDGGEMRCNLKCDPDRALELRDTHAFIIPGYHMNKRHWNTLLMGPGVDAAIIAELVDHSYELIHASLTRKQRAALDG
ncbi:MmcQ/YjbR family DNA-binding protein [Rubritalea marina]|uniref:MmcQ/YjbR family DNA-binding protein n=1 Tax=Rubritalea marina TaxID=361055 RepID=UPI000375082B|nr:MmcQ/YjbR family DNA-binding protein [Rubritalea marina]